MATFTAIRNKTQNARALRGVIEYVEQEKKTRWGDARLVTGHNCVPQSALTEMQMTKQRFRKTGGTQFYHFVQSFSADDNLTPQEVNAIGLEFAQRQFPDFEVVIATHVDTGHLHNHFVVNSVGCVDGHKLHQSYNDLLAHRKVNDEICLTHGLNVLEQPEQQRKKKRMTPG
ncbi:MAG: relaxase/mobilization nuclease domain-containing protein, partial [Oscillospiraceae bacterium]|nr:relaxase/mobilization nuclease domain-containing protein [Oscillospiraceae bacterium]